MFKYRCFQKLFLILFSLVVLPAQATDYYVRPALGNDSNTGNGATESTAWKTLAPINKKNFQAGDKIYLEGTFTYSGSITFNNMDVGTAANPILLTSFGTGKALINSGTSYGFSAYNTAGVHIKNIDFKGAGISANTQNGIVFYSDLTSTPLDGLILENIDVSGYLKSGISIGISNQSSKGFSNVRITNCTSHDNGEAGISSYGPYSTPGKLPHSHFYLAYNTVYNNTGRPEITNTHTGNGIVLAAVDNGIIEHCIAYNNGTSNGQSCGGPVGIWCYDSNNITIQFCESYNNKAGKNCDGGGFDLDGGVTNSILQYNYSHNNEGGGFLLAQYSNALPFKGNTVRYNISENDGRKNSYAGIYIWSSGSNGGIQSTEIYNNTVYITPSVSGTPSAVVVDGPMSGVYFRNNILQTTSGISLIKSSVTSGISFQGNCYWSSGNNFKIQWFGKTYTSLSDFRNQTNQEKNENAATGIFSDPLLASPGTGGTIGNTDQLKNLTAYKVKPESPVINAGLHLKSLFNVDPGSNDFYGTTLPQNGQFDIGANEYTGTINSCTSSGNILREVWTQVSGNEIKNIPVTNPPSSSGYLTSLEGPANSGAVNYGSRIRGYICPPITGNYTFWIASNDHSELWISSNETPSAKNKIAYVSGYTDSRQWNKFPSQKSGLVHLTAGKRYYIEALHKQGAGKDNLSVGWQFPDGTLERPIPGNRLSPYFPSGNNPPVVAIISPSHNATFETPATITLTAEASDNDGSVSLVEFFNGTTKLGEDRSAPFSFIWSNVPAGSYSITAMATDNLGLTSQSTSMIVNVGQSVSCLSTGTITRELWDGVAGNNVTDIPLHLPPSGITYLNYFEGPSNIGYNYGARIRGYVCAPATGNYTFWISSNDHSELWVSTDGNPQNKVKIAFVMGSTGIKQWDKYTSQQSASITLIEGRKYYIEALHKQGVGTDNIAVGWKLPDGNMQRPVPGEVLSPYYSSSEFNYEGITLTPMEKTANEEKSMDIKVFPNPVQKGLVSLTIEGYENEKHKVLIEIRKLTGEVVYEDKIFCDISCRRTILNLDEKFSPGNYIINVLIATKKYSEQLIIQ